MADLITIEDYEARQAEIRSRLKEIDDEFRGARLSELANNEWVDLNEELDAHTATVDELRTRMERIKRLTGSEQHTDRSTGGRTVHPGNSKSRRIPDDPTDLAGYRNLSNNIDDLNQAYRDGARTLLERIRPAHPSVTKEELQGDIDTLISKDDGVALRTIVTSSPKYRKEFETYIKTQGQIVGPEMQRAASLTTTAGGFAVPVELDTTLILTNSGVVNPVRNLARVRQTNVNTVEFINTSGITAAFGAEATEASDNTPVLAQPTVNVEKAFAFVPMSIEIAEDWAGIQADMAMCFADAKNQLEADKFLKGLGHTSTQPQGLIAAGGATAVVTSATTAVFAVADLYSLETALSPRYRGNASIVGNRAAFQKVRQFDTAGGANLWVQLQGSNPAQLLGYNAYEWSNYSSALTTSGSTILTIGDFNYFAIVDRVGMNVEFIPHLFGSGSRFPTGQRGLYAYWRTSSQVLSPGLSANSAFQSLKLL